MEIKAIHRNARTSAQKARLVADMVRGKPVSEATQILRFHNRKAAFLVGKVLDSAIANAVHNNGLNADSLVVSKIYADEGPTMKRIMPRAKGRADQIKKRTAHITVVVEAK